MNNTVARGEIVKCAMSVVCLVSCTMWMICKGIHQSKLLNDERCRKLEEATTHGDSKNIDASDLFDELQGIARQTK